MCSLSFDLLEEARDTKVKGSGQECPLHTSLFYDGSTPFLRVFLAGRGGASEKAVVPFITF